ncbi:YsnF/AvaK domain-containing protein [Azospirillum sp. sgz302134]
MNRKTIVALYDDLSSAERVLGELDSAGLRHDFTMMGADTAKLSAMNSTSAVSSTEAHSGTWRHASEFGYDTDTDFHHRDNRLSVLTRMGVPRGDAEVFAEGIRRGGVLLIGRVDDTRCDEALDIIERHGPVDIEHRGAAYREAGWTGYDTAATDYDATQATEERTRYGTGLGAAAASLRDVNTTGVDRKVETDTTRSDVGRTDVGRTGVVGTGQEERIPVVEEQIHVGKRTVERGAVRVRSYVVETPVEEQVRLRDESVVVERRPVDRELGEVPADAFRERTIEVTETDEEAVVEKAARVREEVVIRKEAEERAQTVSDTVRRTEVEIDDTRTGADRPLDRDRPLTDRPTTDLSGDRPLDRDLDRDPARKP